MWKYEKVCLVYHIRVAWASLGPQRAQNHLFIGKSHQIPRKGAHNHGPPEKFGYILQTNICGSMKKYAWYIVSVSQGPLLGPRGPKPPFLAINHIKYSIKGPKTTDPQKILAIFYKPTYVEV